ncbi:hypothetical protein LOTGIDRAFT_231593 [Lottia gigantea]|uniref:CCZ1/INTU/HSP4 first Longin domain-containing protein n=1 Tax=Lottia gigantea TaxID=225164 RepID=V4AK04_LOTGI|nr:hypothetical protein LOTGIDRAFT_231593 [Lottia gigantea]ESO97422.1 hypothetical protein LOTGIDRAFT_231593 [Lottia gigantea]
MSFLKASSGSASLSTSKQSEYEGNTFFIFDHTVLKREEDDLKDAIIYYFPTIDPDSQCALVGQIIGMSEFFYNAIPRSRPNIMKLHHNKFVLRQRGDYTFKLGTEFLSGLKLLWDIYLPFCENVGDVVGQMFQMLPTVNIPKSSSQLFLHASHILQRSVLYSNVLAGAILYRNQCLCSQLPPNLTKRLLLLKPRQTHITRAQVKTSFELPQGIQLLKVFLKTDEYEHISPRKCSSLRKKHSVRDLNIISKESVGIEGISFLECDSGQQKDLERVENATVETNESQNIEQTDKSGGGLRTESEVNKESDSFLTASDQDDTKDTEKQDHFSSLPLLKQTLAFIEKDSSLDSSHGDDLKAEVKSKEIISVTDADSPVNEDTNSVICLSPQNLDNSQNLDHFSENVNFSSPVSSRNSGTEKTKVDSVDTCMPSSSLKLSFTPEQSPIRQDVSLDTTSSEDLSMGESCVDPQEVKKHAKLLFKTQQMVTNQDTVQQSDIGLGSNTTSLHTKQIAEVVSSDRNKNNPTDLKSPSIATEDSVDVAVVCSSKSDSKTVQFDGDSGIVNSIEFQQPTVVNSSVVPTALDVIADEEENKFIKSSGSSFTSDETQNTEAFGISTTDSLASLESMSMSPPPVRKKSVTFSKTKSPLNTSDGAEENKGWDPATDDLADIVLYAQGHSDMMMLLFFEIGTKCEQKFITNLWKSSVSHLADLDYEVKECLSKEKRDRKTSKTSENYQYLKYDSLMQTMSGNTLEPISSVGYEFINTASKIHDSFLSSKTTTQVLLRSHTSACYGCQAVYNETFFQTSPTAREHGGCPSPKDTVFALDSLAASKLEKHNESLL